MSKHILSVLLFFVAVFCKETALTLPIILFCYDYGFRKERLKTPVILKRYVPYAAVIGIYLVARFHVLEGLAPHQERFGLYQSIINIFPLFAQYLEKLLLPLNLNAFHVLHPISSVLGPRGISGLVVTVAFLLSAFVAFRKSREVFLCQLFMVIPLLPVLYIPVLGQNPFAERYLYLPWFGFVLLTALLQKRSWTDAPKIAGGVTIAFIAMAGLYSLATVERNSVWKDDYSLFEDTVKKSPDAAIPLQFAGHHAQLLT
jgi:hypothetical protein